MFIIVLTIGCLFLHPIVSLNDESFESEEAVNSTEKVYHFNRHVIALTKNKSAANLCFRSLGPDGCDYEEQICLKEEKAACYHAVKLIFNTEENRMERVHYYGCAPYERQKMVPGHFQNEGSLLTVVLLRKRC
jgi:hypothetical protein